MLFLLIVFLLIGAKLLLPSLHGVTGNKTSLLDHYYASWKGVCWGFMEEKMSHRYDEMIIPNKWFFRPPGSGFLFVNPSSLRNTTPQKLLKLLKPVVE
ncbi:hypothetical protein DY000_02062254 [Brassica cretica]|uniref:Uncharacterized protein n=1 Tax=Brassica cretica TaxID=69181 RepID=A0ABQ7AU80_BRACR|nr:hypothetical protein DY000_02062254 [Brassica cretica]